MHLLKTMHPNATLARSKYRVALKGENFILYCVLQKTTSHKSIKSLFSFIITTHPENLPFNKDFPSS